MKKVIRIKIEYLHDDDCRYLETNDVLDCDCRAFRFENEEYELLADNKG